MFMGDYLEGGNFRDEGLKAMLGFLNRVWFACQPINLDQDQVTDSETLYWLHRTIKVVTADIKRFSYNTALARIMELLNHINKTKVKNRAAIETLVKLLSPFAPHLCEELWARLGHNQSIFNQEWPRYIEAHTVSNRIVFVVQVNGKVRAKLEIRSGLPQPEIESLILANEKIRDRIQGKQIVKKIFVPDKLMNLVVQ